MDTVEISDGSITINHDKKCEYINILSQITTVLSEIGSKSADILIPPYKWIKMMDKEIDAGSWKVIAEAREGGNVGCATQMHFLLILIKYVSVTLFLCIR